MPAIQDPAPPPRIGAVERDRAQQRLRDALRDDVLTIVEFDERLGLVLAARTQAELDAVLADLPAPPQSPVPALTECERVVAVLGTTEQRGRWRPAAGLRAVAVLGTAKVDLRDAVSDDGTFEIEAYAALGTVEVIVPDGSAVELEGFSVLGDRENTTAPSAGGPAVRVTGYAVMGEVKVREATRRERRRFPAAGESPYPAPPAATPRPAASRGWGGKVAAIAIIGLLGAGPIRAAATADQAVFFGSGTYTPTPEQLAGERDIEVASFFGSVDVVLPEGASARTGGMQLFGSVECEGPCGAPVDGEQLEIEATTMFGSVEIRYRDEATD